MFFTKMFQVLIYIKSYFTKQEEDSFDCIMTVVEPSISNSERYNYNKF